MIVEMFDHFLQGLGDLKLHMTKICQQEGHQLEKIDLELNLLGYNVSDGEQLFLLRTLSACFTKVSC